ncbi:hypothetical protein SAMN06295912_10892 [Sphingomonas laterariae]|uniref:DUF2946 domain-containing protein n=1 Tax=Edaphosphingomonas laterariae TaxID=861865 RepID=A0A239F6R2_9SPHN|nr:hypothetical protein [Sphingomonas laterariae]SNS52576.1 hypothetical protein SAMN06295912_10892 [Sphingomonas laterariae]
MRGMASAQAAGGRGGFAVMLVALALLMRLLVPAGWMPATDGRAITLCTGMGAVEMWVAADGTIHEKAPVQPGKTTENCVFAALGVAILAPDTGTVVAPPAIAAAPAVALLAAVAIGRGLAAPPPPPTGPPVRF